MQHDQQQKSFPSPLVRSPAPSNNSDYELVNPSASIEPTTSANGSLGLSAEKRISITTSSTSTDQSTPARISAQGAGSKPAPAGPKPVDPKVTQLLEYLKGQNTVMEEYPDLGPHERENRFLHEYYVSLSSDAGPNLASLHVTLPSTLLTLRNDDRQLGIQVVPFSDDKNEYVSPALLISRGPGFSRITAPGYPVRLLPTLSFAYDAQP